MKDVTISTYELFKKFPDEETARIYLEKQRWQGNVFCPNCNNHIRIQKKKAGYYRCLSCQNVFTVRTGTVMERSHIPLNKWIYAMYLLMTARKGISSIQLSKEIGITQKSAWFMLHRIREACENDKKFLKGYVEADECFIGGKEENKHEVNKKHIGRGTVGKTIVLGMRSRRSGKVRAMIIKDTKRDTIKKNIRKNIAKGSILCTDEFKSYNRLGGNIKHIKVNHSAKQFVDGKAHTNGIESVWAVLKRGFYGTYHKFSLKHLSKYINEFSFRLNEGNCKIPSMDRVESLFKGMINKRITYKSLLSFNNF